MMRTLAHGVPPLSLFQAPFDQILNLDHPLLELADQIDWSRLGVALEQFFHTEVEALVLPMRLMVGLLCFMQAFNPCDDQSAPSPISSLA